MIQIWYNSQYLQQHPQSTPFKESSTQHNLAQHKRNLHPLAGIVLAVILQRNVHSKHIAAANATSEDTKKDSASQQCTKQQTSDHINTHWKEKHRNSLVDTFLPNSKSNWKYMSVKLNSHPVCLQIDTALDITLISQRLWKTIGQASLTSTRHVAQSASGDCVHITGELPAIIKLKDKTASGKIYVADSRQPLRTWFYWVTGYPWHPTQFYLQCSIQILNSEHHYGPNWKNTKTSFSSFYK